MLTAVAPSAGTGTVDVTVTTAAGTSPVDAAKDAFTYGTNLALLATASASQPVADTGDRTSATTGAISVARAQTPRTVTC